MNIINKVILNQTSIALNFFLSSVLRFVLADPIVNIVAATIIRKIWFIPKKPLSSMMCGRVAEIMMEI